MRKRYVIMIVALIVLVLCLLCLVLGGLLWNRYKLSQINSFADCAAAGFPILDSYPEQCTTDTGKTYINESQAGVSLTLEGKIVCLPHKNSDGPQTLECAYGLQTDDGKYHALSDPTGMYVFSFEVGERISVDGKTVANSSTIYDIVNTIEIESITKLAESAPRE